MTSALLSIAYLPPVQFYSKIIKYESVLIEYYEHFPKQTYRNRCCIYGANGKLNLSVPLHKRGERVSIKDIKVSNEYNWQKNHWRSIESAYRCSPFFEYYEDDFRPFYNEKKYDFLIELNEELMELINRLLKINPTIKKTEKFEKAYEEVNDFRSIISPKSNLPDDPDFIVKPYKQVFDTKYGFLPNLSIVDLIFNQGPSALSFI